FGRKLLLAAIGIGAVAGPVVLGLLNAPQMRAQSPQTASAPLPSFEVASVKPNRSGDHSSHILLPPGRFIGRNVTTKWLIASAYKLKDFQFSGGPGWLESEKYDFDARAEDLLGEEFHKLPLG